ncbi:hypothetical protein [Oxynema aestuarii]|uniref:Uncharacterized protein n=1 Tax=Oxynema aestuarii AP17 TaxID=2064643 RepID=A0A6H1TT77_9CYAN|nr:hypothetical protein [Oxynema aestuarii]QIZ69347.1 hypothetical protein HCG48_01050 [Oxynema aestuarii AP17]RMH73585.1 MAG: hypothetical protein D6680_16295 [Cyanobacteria bacterium J007]
METNGDRVRAICLLARGDRRNLLLLVILGKSSPLPERPRWDEVDLGLLQLNLALPRLKTVGLLVRRQD